MSSCEPGYYWVQTTKRQTGPCVGYFDGSRWQVGPMTYTDTEPYRVGQRLLPTDTSWGDFPPPYRNGQYCWVQHMNTGKRYLVRTEVKDAKVRLYTVPWCGYELDSQDFVIERLIREPQGPVNLYSKSFDPIPGSHHWISVDSGPQVLAAAVPTGPAGSTTFHWHFWSANAEREVPPGPGVRVGARIYPPMPAGLYLVRRHLAAEDRFEAAELSYGPMPAAPGHWRLATSNAILDAQEFAEIRGPIDLTTMPEYPVAD